MAKALDLPDGHNGGDRMPPEIAALMWPELPSLIDEVVREIRRGVPAFDRPDDSAYDQIIRLGTEKLITAFVEHIADPDAPMTERDETSRALGHFEALEGRTLNSLHAATRIAFHLAWRRAAQVAEREDLPTPVLTMMVEAMIVYMDEAIGHMEHGHRQARAQADLQLREARRQLLEAVLARPADAEMIRRLSGPAGWEVPGQVTMIAVAPDADLTLSALDFDVLTGLDSDEPFLLVPGIADSGRLGMLSAVLGDTDSVIGVTVPLTGATDSLRWARRVLDLAREGVVTRGSLIDGEAHLVTVWLLADPALIEHLANRHLAPLAGLSTHNRIRLTETLREWVTSRGTAVQISEKLRVHPQTVRYRLRQLDEYIGDTLTDPHARFSIELTLRAAHLQSRRKSAGA